MEAGNGRGDVTSLLLAYERGDPGALERVWPLLYEQMRAIARRQLRAESSLTLNPTALVHEAYMRLVDDTRVSWQSRAHFLGVAARCMRQIVVDHARRRNAVKRGGKRRQVELTGEVLATNDNPDLVLSIDAALDAIQSFNGRLARIAECRVFGGLSEEETASALSVSVRTVQRDWQRAKAWLRRELSADTAR
jgi:RNA polymerase sigma factor (TIGR02999 family)